MQPPSVLLMGASGSGKTYSIVTLLEAGLEVFLVGTEPHCLETLLDVVMTRDPKLLMRLHWHQLQPARPGFTTQVNLAKLIASSNQQGLAALQPTPRGDASWIKMLTVFVDFIDQKDGKSYGPVDAFGPERCIVVDSLSGVSSMAMDVTVGDKVTASPGEWGIAMKAISKFILSITSLNCFSVVIAHTEKEMDENAGVSKTMVSTLGKKLAPDIPKFFSEVVLADTESKGDKREFFWSTNTPNVVLKNRALPVGSKLNPDFKPVVEAYRRRLEQTVAKAS